MRIGKSLKFIVLAHFLSIASVAYADAVTDWNNVALNLIRVNRTPPPTASSALAILHASIYDAVNGIARTHEPYVVKGSAPASTSKETAAAVAAHRVLVSLFPNQTETLDALLAADLADIPEGPHKRRGIAWGEFVADAVRAARSNDGTALAVAAPVGTGPGHWVPTAPAFALYLLPQWGFVTPFAIPATSLFRPNGPPALNTAEYLDELREVRLLGAATSSTRTPEQSLIAMFWADGAGTSTPAGHWNTIAQTLATGNTLEENARLFALLNLAMADAGIAAWDAKYVFNFWRPITAIRQSVDPTWTSFVVTPPFPDYVSGHSAFSGAAATVLAAFYGTDRITFTAGSDALPGTIRTFDSFSAAAAEAAISRLYGGIHFRSAIEDGMALGIAIGEWTSAHRLLAKKNRSRR